MRSPKLFLRQTRKSKAACRKIIFIWAIREKGKISTGTACGREAHRPLVHINWVSQDLMTALDKKPVNLEIDVRVFITGMQSTVDNLPSLEMDAKTMELRASSGYNATPSPDSASLKSETKEYAMDAFKIGVGRPDLTALLKEELSLCHGSVAVSGGSIVHN